MDDILRSFVFFADILDFVSSNVEGAVIFFDWAGCDDDAIVWYVFINWGDNRPNANEKSPISKHTSRGIWRPPAEAAISDVFFFKDETAFWLLLSVNLGVAAFLFGLVVFLDIVQQQYSVLVVTCGGGYLSLAIITTSSGK